MFLELEFFCLNAGILSSPLADELVSLLCVSCTILGSELVFFGEFIESNSEFSDDEEGDEEDDEFKFNGGSSVLLLCLLFKCVIIDGDELLTKSFFNIVIFDS